MAHVSDPRFLVSHGLRLKGIAAAPVVADVTGLDERSVADHLASLRLDGHATLREGRVGGWTLTPDGRKHHAAACRDELATAGAEAVVRKAYGRFLSVNGPFLTLCTDWQLRSDAPDGTPILNDHDDAAYDAAVVARLAEVDVAVQPLLVGLTGSMARFGGYGGRLARARARLESGERDWFTGAMIDSYHTVWFELHEDVLLTLGIDRASERSGTSGHPARTGGIGT